jgi:L-fuculose-phosphate aldolase
MAQHGALVSGRTRDETFERAMRLEDVCRRAVKGQLGGPQGDARRAEELKVQAGRVFRHVGYTTAPAVVNAAASTSSFRAQLDDMAQMIGPRLIAVRDDAHAVTRALKSYAAVLVPGVGAICRAESKEDCDALCLLAHKACVSYLHTRALGVSGTLSRLGTWLMRLVYRHKYSKKSEAGNEKEAT